MTTPPAYRIVPLEATEEMLRAYYETKCPPGDTPAGGFTRWATWEEAREILIPQMQRCHATLLAASPPLGEVKEAIASIVFRAMAVAVQNDSKPFGERTAIKGEEALYAATAILNLLGVVQEEGGCGNG